MGLLDRWTKKTEQAKLKDLDKKSVKPATATKTVKKEKVESKNEIVAPVSTRKSVKTESIAYKILVRPLVTEKSAVMESLNKYSFIVSHSATKTQVKQAVAEAYGVRPATVNIMNVEGRSVRFGHGYGRRSDYKKAVVTLATGQSIAIHEGV